ncbi:MAG: response regulator transcription factor [Verrucomicrobia bacterium]|nr:response regulator transcription factor [Verrucomicrobiota bacterium]
MKLMRVLLADDHTIVRAGIRSLLEKRPDVQVVGEASDGGEALELARKLQPDLVLMDIGMSGLNGVEATRRLVKEFPAIKVLMLSMHANEEYALQSLQAGAAGYLLKKSAIDDLEAALKTVMEGKTYICPAMAGRISDLSRAKGWEETSPLSRLTSRQREILQLIAESKNTKEIASLLNLSPKTVEFHRAELMDRLNIHDVPGLVRFAIQAGLVQA